MKNRRKLLLKRLTVRLRDFLLLYLVAFLFLVAITFVLDFFFTHMVPAVLNLELA